MPKDAFEENILGVANLISDDVNKVSSLSDQEEGVESDFEDVLELPMKDEELLRLRDEWENKSNTYLPKVKARQESNKAYIRGVQRNQATQSDRPVASNLLFEATATFVPQALAKNPEPVVWSDNTELGKSASNDVKTLLQYHADVMNLRAKLGVLVWHWSIYFIGILKHGWDEKTSEIKTEVRKPQNFILDPDGYIDEFGDFQGAFLGERISCSADKLIELYPKHKEYITLKVAGKLGTTVVRTEWWTDEYCFTTFMEEVLDKHKNEYFNYETKETVIDEYGIETQTATPGLNHFAVPKMPYTFLSVFSLQEHPHDFTNLIEQNLSNQDRIVDRNDQITKNLASANNAIAISGTAFTAETAQQAVQAFYEEGFLLVPNGDVEHGVKRIPASPLPNGLLETQQNDENKLRSIYGTLGLTADASTKDETARGMILNQNHDSSRIGGGVGDRLEQVADNVFNWWLQLYCVFYDLPHYGAIMGNGHAVEYVTLVNSDLERKFVVSVAPNSMQPKDEVSEQNLAVELYQQKALDPISLFQKLNYPDPMETAKKVALWNINPAQYMMTYFPEAAPSQPVMGAPDPNNLGAPPRPQDQSLAQPEASSALSQVPLSTQAMPQ